MNSQIEGTNIQPQGTWAQGDGARWRATALAVPVALASALFEAQPAAADEAGDAVPAAAAFVYEPPETGMPKVRVGGASRGTSDAHVNVQVLAPEHTGRTLEVRPTLYWHLSGTTQSRFEFTLLDEAGIDPVAELTLEPAPREGINSIDLARLGIDLEPDIEYTWSIAVVLDEAQRSRDVVATGRIQRIRDDASGVAASEDNFDAARVAELARAGVWYDALSALHAHIGRNPDDRTLREGRSRLLEQVGLDLPAEN